MDFNWQPTGLNIEKEMNSLSSTQDGLIAVLNSLNEYRQHQRSINDSCIPYVDSSQYVCMSCVYCGGNHLYEYCPYNTTSHFVRDDFTRNQACFDNSFCHSEGFEQQNFMDPYVYCSYENTPPCYSYSYVEEHTIECREKSNLERLVEECGEALEKSSKEHREIFSSIESHVQNIKSSVQNMGVYASQILSTLETMVQDNSLNLMTTSYANNDYCEEVEGVELHETMDNVESDCKLDIDLDENIGCLEEVPAVEPKDCDVGDPIDVDVPIVVVHDPTLEVLTLTDESQVDFIGCSKFLDVPIFIFKDMHVVLNLNSVNTCIPRLSTIKEVQVINLNDQFLCEIPCCLKRNEDKVIMVFDTYD